MHLSQNEPETMGPCRLRGAVVSLCGVSVGGLSGVSLRGRWLILSGPVRRGANYNARHQGRTVDAILRNVKSEVLGPDNALTELARPDPFCVLVQATCDRDAGLGHAHFRDAPGIEIRRERALLVAARTPHGLVSHVRH